MATKKRTTSPENASTHASVVTSEPAAPKRTRTRKTAAKAEAVEAVSEAAATTTTADVPAPQKKRVSSHRRASSPKQETPQVSAPVEAIVEMSPVAHEPEAVQQEAALPSSIVAPLSQPETEAEDRVPTFTITHEDISRLAFSYWERRGYQGGSPDEDWQRAQEELLSLIR